MSTVKLYYDLLHNAEKLQTLWQQSRLDEFVRLLKLYLQWPDANFEQLQLFLTKQNSLPFCPQAEQFSQCWQPSAYQPKQKTIRWIPAFAKLSLPFLEDDIALSRQRLLAQFIQPYSNVAELLAQQEKLPPVQPALLIFHWSRCGSTLLSGSFMLHPKCKVLSESMLVSDLLADPYWQPQQEKVLDLAIRLQGRFRHAEEKLIIKCNAWDLQHWHIWLKAFPSAQVVCLIRQPEAILASHEQQAGKHMVSLQPALWHELPQSLPLLEYRIKVIQLMADYMQQILAKRKCKILTYEQLKETTPAIMAGLANIKLTTQQTEHWLERHKFDAKQRGVLFKAATKTALEVFNANQLEHIRQTLMPVYQNLVGSGN